MKRLFFLFLLTSSSVYGNLAETITLTEGPIVNFCNDIVAWAKEVPGKVFIKHKHEKATLCFIGLKEDGFDAIVFQNDEQLLEAAKKANLTVSDFTHNGEQFHVIVLKTDKHDDIVDWLSI